MTKVKIKIKTVLQIVYKNLLKQNKKLSPFHPKEKKEKKNTNLICVSREEHKLNLCIAIETHGLDLLVRLEWYACHDTLVTRIFFWSSLTKKFGMIWIIQKQTPLVGYSKEKRRRHYKYGGQLDLKRMTGPAILPTRPKGKVYGFFKYYLGK